MLISPPPEAGWGPDAVVDATMVEADGLFTVEDDDGGPSEMSAAVPRVRESVAMCTPESLDAGIVDPAAATDSSTWATA